MSRNKEVKGNEFNGDDSPMKADNTVKRNRKNRRVRRQTDLLQLTTVEKR